MESIVVHPKNQTELNALKGVLKDMGIKFEKFHTRTNFSAKKPADKADSGEKSKRGKVQ